MNRSCRITLFMFLLAGSMLFAGCGWLGFGEEAEMNTTDNTTQNVTNTTPSSSSEPTEEQDVSEQLNQEYVNPESDVDIGSLT